MRMRAVSLMVAGCVAMSAGAAQAAEYVYGSWVGPKNPVLAKGIVPYFQAVEKDTGGSLTWKILAGGQLFGPGHPGGHSWPDRGCRGAGHSGVHAQGTARGERRI